MFPIESWRRLAPYLSPKGLRALRRESLLDLKGFRPDTPLDLRAGVMTCHANHRVMSTHAAVYPLWAGDPTVTYADLWRRFSQVNDATDGALDNVMDWADDQSWDVALSGLLAACR